MIKTAKATMDWTLMITCPYCGAKFDLSDQDDDCIFVTAIFNNKWGALKGEEVECYPCKQVFKISDVEY